MGGRGWRREGKLVGEGGVGGEWMGRGVDGKGFEEEGWGREGVDGEEGVVGERGLKEGNWWGSEGKMA